MHAVMRILISLRVLYRDLVVRDLMSAWMTVISNECIKKKMQEVEARPLVVNWMQSEKIIDFEFDDSQTMRHIFLFFIILFTVKPDWNMWGIEHWVNSDFRDFTSIVPQRVTFNPCTPCGDMIARNCLQATDQLRLLNPSVVVWAFSVVGLVEVARWIMFMLASAFILLDLSGWSCSELYPSRCKFIFPKLESNY